MEFTNLCRNLYMLNRSYVACKKIGLEGTGWNLMTN